MGRDGAGADVGAGEKAAAASVRVWPRRHRQLLGEGGPPGRGLRPLAPPSEVHLPPLPRGPRLRHEGLCHRRQGAGQREGLLLRRLPRRADELLRRQALRLVRQAPAAREPSGLPALPFAGSRRQASHRLLRLHPRLAPRPVRKRRRLGEGGGSGPHPPARLPRRRLHPQKAARGPGRFRALAQGRGHARDHLLAPQAHGLERLRAVPSGNFRRREEGRDALHDGGELRGAVLRRLPQHGGLPMLDCQRCHTGPVQ